MRVDSVSFDEAQISGAMDLGEAIARPLNLEVAPTRPWMNAPTGIQLAGLDGNRVLVVEDGEPVFGDSDGAIDPRELPLVDASHIEVARGPLGSVWGLGAMAGVVHLRFTPPAVEGFSGTTLLDARQPWGMGLVRTIALRQGDLWAAFNASVSANDGVRLEDSRADTAIAPGKRQQFVFRAGMRVAPRVCADARFRYGRLRESGSEEGAAGEVDLSHQSHRISARFRALVDLGRGRGLELATSGQFWLKSAERDLRGADEVDAAFQVHSQRSVEASAWLGRGDRLSGALGVRVETRREDDDLEAVGDTGLSTRLAPSAHASLTSATSFGEARWELDPHVAVVGGTALVVGSDLEPVLLPRVTVTMRDGELFAAHLHGGRGHRVPSARERRSYEALTGGSELAPESIWGISADLVASPLRSLRFRAGGFADLVTDSVDARLALSETVPVDTVRPDLVQDVVTAGAQSDVTIRWSSELRSEAGYTFLHTRGRESDAPLPGRAAHRSHVALFANLPERVRLLGRWRFFSEAPAGEEASSPAYSLLDLRAAKGLWPSSEVYAAVHNLLAARRAPGQVGDLRPAEGRTWMVGLRFEFPASESD
jgi:outer membrane receptor for ferrienterochelin and colicins